MNLEEITQQIIQLAVTYGTKLIGAIAVLIIGRMVIKFLTKRIGVIMDKRDVDASLKPFLKSLITNLLRALLIITVLSMMGIEMTSFIAILGAAGLAVGMALSGTLQNFAGGVMILLFEPFKVGDYIEAQGHKGVVKEIQIFNTILTTLDNKRVIIPNGGLSNSSMVNYTAEPIRRVDWTIGMGYGDSVEKCQEVIRQILAEDDKVLSEPQPVFVEVSELGDSSVNFAVRAWVKTEDYWAVFFRLNQEVYKRFGDNGLNIPFPQMDVHVHNQ